MELVDIVPSTKQAKKLMAIFRDGTKTWRVHFGAASYMDYTLYRKKASPQNARAKRDQYIARHGATEDWSDPTTPATLSRYILWEEPTVDAAVKAYRRRFGV